jgi:hypothetical protein
MEPAPLCATASEQQSVKPSAAAKVNIGIFHFTTVRLGTRIKPLSCIFLPLVRRHIGRFFALNAVANRILPP